MQDNEICGTPWCANIKYDWLQIRMADGNIRGEKNLFSLTTARGSYEWRASWKSLSGCSRPASLNETPFCGWISFYRSCGPLQPEWKLPMTRFNCDLFPWKRSIFLTLFIYLLFLSFLLSFLDVSISWKFDIRVSSKCVRTIEYIEKFDCKNPKTRKVYGLKFSMLWYVYFTRRRSNYTAVF